MEWTSEYVTEKFGDDDIYDGYFNCGYGSIIDSAPGEVIDNETIGSWQGDILVLLKNEDKYGFWVIGYGSCSICDAYESCSSAQDIADLRNSLVSNIKWGSKEEIRNYLNNRDSGLDWWLNEDEAEKTLKRFVKLLS